MTVPRTSEDQGTVITAIDSPPLAATQYVTVLWLTSCLPIVGWHKATHQYSLTQQGVVSDRAGERVEAEYADSIMRSLKATVKGHTQSVHNSTPVSSERRGEVRCTASWPAHCSGSEITQCFISPSVDMSFLPRDAMLSAVYAVVVCPSVCLSLYVCVCLSHSGIVSKRLNVGSRK